MPFVILAPKDFEGIWLSILSTLCVHDERLFQKKTNNIQNCNHNLLVVHVYSCIIGYFLGVDILYLFDLSSLTAKL